MKFFRQTWLILSATLLSAVAAGQSPSAPQDGPALPAPYADAGAPAAGVAPDNYESWVQSLQPSDQLAGNPYVRPSSRKFEADDLGRIPVRIFNAEVAGGAYPTAPPVAKPSQNNARQQPVRSPMAADLTADLNRVSRNTGVQQTSLQAPPPEPSDAPPGPNTPPGPSNAPLPPEALRELPPGAVVTDPRTGAVIGVVPGGQPPPPPGQPIASEPSLEGQVQAQPAGPPKLLDSLGFYALYYDAIEPIVFTALSGASSFKGPPEDPRLYMHGWMEQGLTLNPDSPRDRQNGPVLFNDRSNEYMLNQLYLYAGRRCETDGCNWDYGGRIDFMFGTDARFLSSTGLELHQDGSRKWMAESAEVYGVALPQLYAEVSAPVASGLNIKVGHFYSIFGFERLTAPDSFFYSHSYARIFGMPGTFTGGMATQYLPPNIFFKKDQFSLTAGITQGWDTWARNDNDLGFLFGFSMDIIERRSSFSGALHVGQEPIPFIIDGRQIGRDNVVVNLIYTKQLTDQLAFVSEFTGGSQKGGKLYVDQVNSTTAFGNARWYGLNNYLLYEINTMWSAGARLEWFYDADMLRVARLPIAFNPGGDLFFGNNYFNLTMGLNWTPRPRVLVRPELRIDWSDFKNNPDVSSVTARPYDDASQGSQFLLATDVILSF